MTFQYVRPAHATEHGDTRSLVTYKHGNYKQFEGWAWQHSAVFNLNVDRVTMLNGGKALSVEQSPMKWPFQHLS